jgi:hypothetical protein
MPDTPGTAEIAGIELVREESAAAGAKTLSWTGRPAPQSLPLWSETEIAARVRRPAAYWVPAEASEVIARLSLHGIRMERVSTPREVDVEMQRFVMVETDREYFEGHVRVKALARPERRRESFAPGSVRVPTDQPLGTLAVLLLEPSSPDSFFQWGFFPGCLQRTEYVEEYVMAPMADRMLAEDPALGAAFRDALQADSDLAADPQKRLDWFYRRTPFHDDRYLLYPVGREVGLAGP